MDTTINSTDLPAASPLFAARQAGRDVRVGSVTFRVEALTSRQQTYIQSRAQLGGDTATPETLMWDSVRFGVKSVSGGMCQDGMPYIVKHDTINIMGKPCQVMSDDTMDALPAGLIVPLFVAIETLTSLSPAEVDKLDFFTLSGGELQIVMKAAPAVAGPLEAVSDVAEPTTSDRAPSPS